MHAQVKGTRGPRALGVGMASNLWKRVNGGIWEVKDKGHSHCFFTCVSVIFSIIGMDTPETNPSISPSEDSPFFIFANALSPIKPVKSAQISQIFSSAVFPSPPRVFNSPHVNCYKEPKFLRSHNPVTTSRPEDVNKFQTNEEAIADSIHSYHNLTESQESPIVRVSAVDRLVPLHGQHTEFSAEIPQALKYNNCGNPGYDPAHKTNSLLGLHGEATTNFAYFQESCRIDPNDRELLNQGFFQFDSKMQESDLKGWRHWDDSVPEDTEIIFGSPNDTTSKSVDHSMTLQYGLKDDHPVNTEQKPYTKFVSAINCGTRRRHLNFEKASLPGFVTHSDEESLANEKQLVPAKCNSSSEKCILPGIGFHLEAFEALKLDKKVINNDKLSCGIHPSLPSCTFSLQFFTSHEHQGALAMELDSSDSTIGEDFNQNSPKKKRQVRL
ncbi:hypothetical protein PIB30_027419 [Stylosanthes scabra]|uniref:Uncharacterized protein n=1 Tax=Stylosanthes scabra TaxID=79078 RepID=A0ABU6WAB5_9FABA|nr:hypothetical protein [Stylosanthes scabra]